MMVVNRGLRVSKFPTTTRCAASPQRFRVVVGRAAGVKDIEPMEKDPVCPLYRTSFASNVPGHGCSLCSYRSKAGQLKDGVVSRYDVPVDYLPENSFLGNSSRMDWGRVVIVVGGQVELLRSSGTQRCRQRNRSCSHER